MDWFGLLFVPVVVGLVWMIFRNIIPAGWHSLRSYWWVPTKGIISQSDITEFKTLSNGTRYKISITYDYHVGDKTYSSNRLSFGDAMLEQVYEGRQKRTAQKIIKKHPAWGFVQVYYNPKNPAEATLKQGPFHIGYLAYSLFMLYFTLAMAVGFIDGLISLFGS